MGHEIIPIFNSLLRIFHFSFTYLSYHTFLSIHFSISTHLSIIFNRYMFMGNKQLKEQFQHTHPYKN